MARKLLASPVIELETVSLGLALSVPQSKITHPPSPPPPHTHTHILSPHTLDAPPFKLAFESNDDSSDNAVVMQSYFDEDTGTGSSHFFQCFWRRQSLFGRIMMVFSLGFIVFAILTCCFATCGNSTEEENESHLKEVRNTVRIEGRVVGNLRVFTLNLETQKIGKLQKILSNPAL